MILTRPLALVATLAGGLLILVACDKDSGQTQRAAGKIKSAAGSVTGDEALKREGKKDEVVGGVKTAASDLKGAVKDAQD